MRRPTSPAELFDWHKRASAHFLVFGTLRNFDDPPTHEPQCGYYERRLVKNGPWVAAAIWMEQIVDAETGELTQPERLMCEVDGKCEDAEQVWTYLCGRPIDEARYRFLHADARWVRANRPDDPKANPRQPIDPLTMQLPYE